MDAQEQKALSDIEKFGLHIINVMEEDDLPPFSYSIGIENTLGQPELIVIGLTHTVAQSVINLCYQKIKAGEKMHPSHRVSDLIEGFECQIGEVSEFGIRSYMGWALWLHKGLNFRALQIIFPSTSGVWPWESEASEWFKNRQPLLANIREYDPR